MKQSDSPSEKLITWDPDKTKYANLRDAMEVLAAANTSIFVLLRGQVDRVTDLVKTYTMLKDALADDVEKIIKNQEVLSSRLEEIEKMVSSSMTMEVVETLRFTNMKLKARIEELEKQNAVGRRTEDGSKH